MLSSYAQNFEDVILWRALKHVDVGFYIDIGAQDPVTDSVSLAFYEQGWRGVHVEPVPAFAEKLRLMRPDEEVVEAIVGTEDSNLAFFQVDGTGLSTGNAAIAERHAASGYRVIQTQVPCVRLAAILDKFQDRDIHWLKIDVEGMEKAVIESWLPSKVRPWVVVVECTAPGMPEPAYADWDPLLIELGYEFVYFDGLNRFYVNREHSELKSAFGAGPNVFDDFALNGSQSTPFIRKAAGEIDAGRRTIAHLESELTASNANIAAMRSSASWRLTAPLRKLDEWLRSPVLYVKAAGKRLSRAGRVALDGLKQMYVSAANAAKGIVKGIARPFAASAIRFVMAHPALRLRLRGWLRRYPVVESRIRRFAAARGLLSGGATTPSMAASGIGRYAGASTFSALTEHGRQTYAALRAAAENKQGQ